MLKIDLHVHGINSGHAYATLYEIAREASQKGMEMFALTDHGPALKGTTGGVIHFRMNYRAPQRRIYGVRVLWGCEANVLNHHGDLDLPDKELANLDVVLIGIHPFTGFNDRGEKVNTMALQAALKNPHVDILAHPNYQTYPINAEACIASALDNNKLVELNLAKLRNHTADLLEPMRRMVQQVKDRMPANPKPEGAMLIVNSDAHFLNELGDDEILTEYWDRLGLDERLIINNFPEVLQQRLKYK